MEVRNLKMNFVKSGSGSTNTRANLPITDCRDMGIVPESREYSYYYDKENKIMIISKEEFKDIKIKITK